MTQQINSAEANELVTVPRAEWQRPQLRRLDAGDAQGTASPTGDDGHLGGS